MKSRPRTALITGAAARIGAAITTVLHQRGHDVLIHYNSSAEPARLLADQLNELRADSAAVISADLSSPGGVGTLVDAGLAFSDRLDVLVNNASRFYPTEVGDTRPYQWDDLMDSNLRGPYFLSQGLLAPLRKAEGCIINLLDVHADRPMLRHPVYSISKAGLAMMTCSLARELGPEIRVNGVSPGAILWPENETDESARETILARTALKRVGEPGDIASAVAYLALDAPYVTGQILAVDGGRSLNI